MITISRQKQVFSFLPIQIKIGNNNYKKLSSKNEIKYETDKNYIELKIKFLGLRKKLDFYKNSADNNFVVFMNIEKNFSYAVLAAMLLCFALVVQNLITSEPNMKLIGVAVLFSVFYLLNIFQSITIKPKE